jgi:hypothetical protein
MHSVGFEHTVIKDTQRGDKMERGLRSFVVGLFDALFGAVGLGNFKEESAPEPKGRLLEQTKQQEEREREK